MNELQELQAWAAEWCKPEISYLALGALPAMQRMIKAVLDECETIIAADNGKQKHESAMSWWHYEGQKDSAEHVVDAMHKAMEAGNEV